MLRVRSLAGATHRDEFYFNEVIHILEESETAFAVLLALVVESMPRVVLREYDTPESMWNGNPESLVWSIPDFLRWGDLETLRALAISGPEKEHSFPRLFQRSPSMTNHSYFNENRNTRGN